MLKYGSQLLSLQEQYQNKDDLALCHLRYGLAQAYKSAGKDDLCRELIRGAREVSSVSLHMLKGKERGTLIFASPFIEKFV